MTIHMHQGINIVNCSKFIITRDKILQFDAFFIYKYVCVCVCVSVIFSTDLASLTLIPIAYSFLTSDSDL